MGKFKKINFNKHKLELITVIIVFNIASFFFIFSPNSSPNVKMNVNFEADIGLTEQFFNYSINDINIGICGLKLEYFENNNWTEISNEILCVSTQFLIRSFNYIEMSWNENFFLLIENYDIKNNTKMRWTRYISTNCRKSNFHLTDEFIFVLE